MPAQSEPLETALAEADAVVVATDHTEYEKIAERLPSGVVVVDPWNITGVGQVFADTRGHVTS